MHHHRAVFFDKDGVVNELVDRGENFILGGKEARYTAPWHVRELRIFREIIPVVREVKARGYLAMIVTNQPDLRYGVMEKESLALMLTKIKKLGFDDIFFCPHGRDDNCECRKPKPGMLFAAAKKWEVDLSRSFMLGDLETDLEAAHAAGSVGLLVDTSYNKDVSARFRLSSLIDLLALLR